MQSLKESIEGLYRAFADVPRPRQIEGCQHCLDDRDIHVLLSTPLRELTPSDLAPYASSAFLTVGDAADYLYFLPRILEISATDDAWWPDPEVSGKCIRAAKPQDWPDERVEAVSRFNMAVIGAALAAGTYRRLDSWICAIARMGFDVRPHLVPISKDPAAVLAYFEENAKCLPENRLCNAFWELPCPGHDAIVEWFYSDKIRSVPYEAYGFCLERKN